MVHMTSQTTTSATALPTQRQRDILAAAALREAAACYPEGAKPAKAYWALSDLLWAELGDCGESEIEEALESAIALNAD